MTTPTETKQKLPEFQEMDLVASICRESFYEFVQEFWSIVIPEVPIWNWHIKLLCDELQTVAERVFKGESKPYDLVVNIPPGTTKSTICSVMFPAWVWTRMPHARCICASYAYPLAMDLSRKTRDIVKSEKYRECFPEIDLREDQDSKAYFVNTKMGYRYAVGVNGSVMGMHAHFLIVDDPLDPMQATSDAEIKIANHWMSETLPSRCVNKAVTPLILIMQRLAENDPTGARLEKTENAPVRWICLPAELTDKVRPRHLRRFYKDGLLDPVRLSRSVLEQQLAQLLDYGYAGQYLEDPVPRGGGMFHTDMLRFGSSPPQFKRIARSWDKAGTLGGGAYTAGVKLGVDMKDNVWILDVIRGQWDTAKREAIIQKATDMDGKDCLVVIEQEPGSGGKESAENTVRRLMGYRVKVVNVGNSEGSKEQRADPFSTQVNAGNVYLVNAGWNFAFIAEMKHFPRSRFKDQIDAASNGFNAISTRTIRVGGLSVLNQV